MAKPYSQDLRDRVIDAVERGKMSRREAGRHYEVSESVGDQDLVDAEAPVVRGRRLDGSQQHCNARVQADWQGEIIGTGALVMRDVPRYGIMVGAPARLVGFRFPLDVVEAIEATEWWLLDKHALKRGVASVPEFLVSPSVESALHFSK
jgi:hypothetical protein